MWVFLSPPGIVKMRIGVFGGSFDPPHIGHLMVAHAAADAFCLGHVMFVPTGLQPLKPQGATASFQDRLQMVSLLCSDTESGTRFSASALDAPMPDGSPNYSVDTLARVKRQLDAHDQLYVILGADAFAGMPHWHRSNEVMDMADWIVVSRPGFNLARLRLSTERLQRVHLLDGVCEPANATQVRQRLAQGLDCSDLLPAPVAKYIQEHHLYEAAIPNVATSIRLPELP
jgi:nicotinate-nucleotide adenylyltransferase